jgi:hypothetical protein
VDFETNRTLQTKRYLIIRLFKYCNALKENFFPNYLNIPVAMYLEQNNSQAQRQFRKMVETFNKISLQYEASTFEIIRKELIPLSLV